MKRIIMILTACLLFSAVPALASDDHERIEALESRVDALEQIINEFIGHEDYSGDYVEPDYLPDNTISYGHQLVYSNDVFDVYLDTVSTQEYKFTVDNKSDGRFMFFINEVYVNGEEICSGDMCIELFAHETGMEIYFTNSNYHGYDLPTDITSMSGILEIQECEELYGDFYKDFDFSCEITPPEAE